LGPAQNAAAGFFIVGGFCIKLRQTWQESGLPSNKRRQYGNMTEEGCVMHYRKYRWILDTSSKGENMIQMMILQMRRGLGLGLTMGFAF